MVSNVDIWNTNVECLFSLRIEQSWKYAPQLLGVARVESIIIVDNTLLAESGLPEYTQRQTASSLSFARKSVGKHGSKNSKLRASVICEAASRTLRGRRKTSSDAHATCGSRLLHSPLVCHACRHAHFPYGFSSKRETARSLTQRSCTVETA